MVRADLAAENSVLGNHCDGRKQLRACDAVDADSFRSIGRQRIGEFDVGLCLTGAIFVAVSDRPTLRIIC